MADRLSSWRTECELSLPVLVEGTYDEGESVPLVTVTHVWLRMDGLPDLDLWPYLGGLASQLVTRELQADLDYYLEGKE